MDATSRDIIIIARARERRISTICARRVYTHTHTYTHTHYTYRVVVVALALMETLPKAADCVNALIVKGVVCVSRARVRIARARRRACMGSRHEGLVPGHDSPMRVHLCPSVVLMWCRMSDLSPPAPIENTPGRDPSMDRCRSNTTDDRQVRADRASCLWCRMSDLMHACVGRQPLKWGRGGGDACALRARVIRRRKRRRRRRGIEGDLT